MEAKNFKESNLVKALKRGAEGIFPGVTGYYKRKEENEFARTLGDEDIPRQNEFKYALKEAIKDAWFYSSISTVYMINENPVINGALGLITGTTILYKIAETAEAKNKCEYANELKHELNKPQISYIPNENLPENKKSERTNLVLTKQKCRIID